MSLQLSFQLAKDDHRGKPLSRLRLPRSLRRGVRSDNTMQNSCKVNNLTVLIGQVLEGHSVLIG